MIGPGSCPCNSMSVMRGQSVLSEEQPQAMSTTGRACMRHIQSADKIQDTKKETTRFKKKTKKDTCCTFNSEDPITRPKKVQSVRDSICTRMTLTRHNTKWDLIAKDT